MDFTLENDISRILYTRMKPDFITVDKETLRIRDFYPQKFPCSNTMCHYIFCLVCGVLWMQLKLLIPLFESINAHWYVTYTLAPLLNAPMMAGESTAWIFSTKKHNNLQREQFYVFWQCLWVKLVDKRSWSPPSPDLTLCISYVHACEMIKCIVIFLLLKSIGMKEFRT
jgi:hypothetical protein